MLLRTRIEKLEQHRHQHPADRVERAWLESCSVADLRLLHAAAEGVPLEVSREHAEIPS